MAVTTGEVKVPTGGYAPGSLQGWPLLSIFSVTLTFCLEKKLGSRSGFSFFIILKFAAPINIGYFPQLSLQLYLLEPVVSGWFPMVPMQK